MNNEQCTSDLLTAIIPLIAAITLLVNAIVAYVQTRILTSRIKQTIKPAK